MLFIFFFVQNLFPPFYNFVNEKRAKLALYLNLKKFASYLIFLS
jgi:hypothetical protein